MQHDAKKSLEWGAIYGTLLMLQMLCLLTPIIDCCSQFWLQISKTVVCTYVRIQFAMIRQEELVQLTCLLRLLCTTMCTHFLRLSLTGLALMLFITRIAAYILNFLFLRHCRIVWTGLTIIAKVLATTALYLLENDDNIFPLVRAILFAAKFIILILFQCLCGGVLACNICTGKRTADNFHWQPGLWWQGGRREASV